MFTTRPLHDEYSTCTLSAGHLMKGLTRSKMAAEGRTRVRLSVASQFFNNEDVDSLAASGENSAEDSTSEKVSSSNRRT